MLNRLAKLSVKACARLGGYYEGDLSSPENIVAKTLFEKLLTPHVAEQFTEENPHNVNFFSILIKCIIIYIKYIFSAAKNTGKQLRDTIYGLG